MNRFSLTSTKNIFDFLFNEERRSSVVLLCAAVAALLLANSVWSDYYFNFFSHHISLGSLNLDIKHWINEGLMALFFLTVGIEIKREFIDGELKTWRRAAFPVVAAVGGMIVPALIFTAINPTMPHSMGWAIPMATDIAIAIGVVGLLGNKIPKTLRVFLLTLAIVDDIGSIFVMSLFYSQPTNMFALMISMLVVLFLFMVRRQKYWPVWFLLGGILLWYCLLLSGISATIAGVIIAFLMPLTTNTHSSKPQTSELIEDILVPITSFMIVPLFVFANTGIAFSGINLLGNGSGQVFIGVLVGLFIGKPVGILLASMLGKYTKLIHIPKEISWSQLGGIGFIAGIGFTISLLISGIAYQDYIELQNASTIGIFSASILSGLVGLLLLNRSFKNPSKSAKY